MKYAVFCDHAKDAVEYTVSVLNHLIKINGHQLVDPGDADILAVSVCDVTQIRYVEKIRALYPNKTILVGGHAAIYWKLFLLFADIIHLGEGFELFRCQSIDEIKELKSVVFEGKNNIIEPSTFIDWKTVPVANVTQKQKYYWGSVGCKNKCKFCLTSWTHPYQKNSMARINNILSKYPTCTIVSNDSVGMTQRMTQSIMLKDFLVAPLKKYSVYRIGVEFATEGRRRKYGKPFSDDMFVRAVDRAYDEGVRLKLFCISGIDMFEDWRGLFDQLHPHYQKGNIEVKFTNVNYEMFTPIKAERYDISVDKMFSTQIARDFISGYKPTNFALKSLPCTSVRSCLEKNILLYTTNADEYALYKRMKKQPEADMVNYFREMSRDNDYSDTVKIDLRPIR
jgi:hypothetical protein